MEILSREMVVLGAQPADRFDAIRQAGALLVEAGRASQSYIAGMLARERVLSTYLGHGIAIPHGEIGDLQYVRQTGISVLQVPDGVEWDPGERAHLVVGLASTGMQHAAVMANLVELLQAPEQIAPLIHATDPMVIVERLSRGRSEIVWN